MSLSSMCIKVIDVHCHCMLKDVLMMYPGKPIRIAFRSDNNTTLVLYHYNHNTLLVLLMLHQ